MKFLVFGATGCLGTSFQTLCEEQGHKCVGLSHQDIDIRDHAAVRDRIFESRPDAILNAVAIVGINPCEENPALAFDVHAIATRAYSNQHACGI